MKERKKKIMKKNEIGVDYQFYSQGNRSIKRQKSDIDYRFHSQKQLCPPPDPQQQR